MNNPKILQLQFSMKLGENSCALHVSIKPTEHPHKFHILRVQPLNTRENASVINDFYISKIEKEGIATWVHAGSEISSGIVQAIGNALDQHFAPSMS